ncbi:uncharacterized protein LOC133829994 [Humulus lupulus]|uniref:uncharacterized protein LOC133829994 n=1 Tax=Humulus lupulus TaxID=3486 RepID=UPI002B40C66F|nr:uncharacterized protein LOC133829994 [Humulus lupulus]
MAMEKAKEHIEEIRRDKYSIGGKPNTLTEDLHQAVMNLSAELYAKDVHFLMELIQNAEDNEYVEGVDPSLEFIITSKDITATGAPATLLICNNERGFSRKNIDSICGVGRSTKKGNRKRGYIGEKGIGFKSVFLITARPYIFSNGYQIRFHEEPCQHCNLGYIVPEWVDENPTLSELKQIYGSSGSALPTTILILPLKPDKVRPVKQQLSSIHPQVLLFLSKIKKLSIREDNEDPRLNAVNAIAISKETDFRQRKNIDAESFTLHLSAEENGAEKECMFYMWKQKFPVRPENREEKRSEIEEWAITLAFPFGERLQRGTHSPGIYAYLPTEMVTNFPFIIQADFLLASSRETILLDSKWNQGILGCVPTAFIDAFKSMVKTSEDAPVWNLPDKFRFLPVNPSNHVELNVVRNAIKAKLLEEDIVPSEMVMEQKFFHKPREVGRLMPAFWCILDKAAKEGVSMLKLSSHGKFILSSSFDREEYDHILNFLEVQPVDNEWYAKCIQGFNLAGGVSDHVYLELLLFIADNWSSKFYSTNIKNIPLIKYEDRNGNISTFSISESVTWNGQSLVYLSHLSSQTSWLIKWNKEFGPVSNRFFMPEITQEVIWSFPRKETLLKWLQDYVKIGVVEVNDYAVLLSNSVFTERKLAILFAHFLYHSMLKKYLMVYQVDQLCSIMPLVDSYGCVITRRSGILVPSKGSKWAGLVLKNLWRGEGYVELNDDYLSPFRHAGKLITQENGLISFLKTHAKACDVPCIPPPDAPIAAVSGVLTKSNTFLLLDWIRYFIRERIPIPNKFLTSIKEQSWLKITLNGCPGSRPPPQSFLHSSSFYSWGSVLQNESVLVDIPLVDLNYYGEEIRDYEEELKKVGVMSEYGEACQFIGKHLMSLAASGTLTKSNVISILKFIKFLRSRCLPPEEFINSIKQEKWLRTSCGDRCPAESVLFDNYWKTASKISDIPFIDEEYYGEEILSFKTELGLLGVVVAFSGSHQLVVDHLRPSSHLSSLSSDSLLLILQCMRHSNSTEKIVRTLRGTKCLKTKVGYKSPHECILCDPEWVCLLQVFNDLPVVDQNFYGKNIFIYRNELKQIGVVVDFEGATKLFVCWFKEHASKKSIFKENVISFLSCYRRLKETSYNFPTEAKNCIRKEKWLRTRHCDYYRSPKDCILYGSDWESIFSITSLPFIDDSENWYGTAIYEYEKELKSMGVVTDFKDGVEIIATCLYFHDVSRITSSSALSLLECIKILLKKTDYSFPESFPVNFRKELSKEWLKTYVGYRRPSECLLFDSKWGEFLTKMDGPFIDEEFYGSKIVSYSGVLKEIGVIVDVDKGCSLIASQLGSHTELSTIVRIYNYLSKFKWEPKSEEEKKIWIPNGSYKGVWVGPEDCVISDKSELFSLQLTILDKYYKGNLIFFSSAFQVKCSPSIEDYCKLWKCWESSGHKLSHDECCKFWSYIIKHSSSKAEKDLRDKLEKVPVNSCSNSIVLVDKHDVFVADDLQLKYLFEQSSSHPIFVWYPQPSMPSLPRTKLLEVFQKIGVRTISESVKKEEVSIAKGAENEQVIPRDALIGKGLIKLILGFLAHPSLNMDAKERHEAMEDLLNVTVLETVEPIDVSYNLSLSSGKSLNVIASGMVRWDKESSKIFNQKMDMSKGPENLIKRATYFSQVIAEGVLWQNSDHIDALSELLKFAFLLEFNEKAVDFFMKSRNLQIFLEDEEFISSAFSSV